MGILFNRKKGSGFDDDTFVIVGLGNPGAEYEKTRHNMGFRALDVLSSDTGIDIRRAKFHALIGQGRIAGHKVILVKPQTYMNRSGIAVREAAMYYNVPSCNVIVIYDDIDLPLSAIRVRKSGGAGTHNGMKSVVQQLGVKDFPRIRIGVGAQDSDEDLVDRVIGKVPKAEQALLDQAAAAAAKAAEDIVRSGIDIAMNRHNYTPAKKTKEDKASDPEAKTHEGKTSAAEGKKSPGGKAIQQQGAGASDTKVIQQQGEKSPGAGSGAGASGTGPDAMVKEHEHEIQQQ